MSFPFTFEEIHRYQDILSWLYLAGNEQIAWTTEIIDAFKIKLWSPGSCALAFTMNEALPWSVDFIKRHEDCVDWNYMVDNKVVMYNKEILDYYGSKLDHYARGGIEKYRVAEGCPEKLATLELMATVEDDLKYFASIPELQLQHPDEHNSLQEVDWGRMSYNGLFDWSIELIDQYLDQWIWSALAENESVPWDLEMLVRYEDFLHWPIFTPSGGETTTIPSGCIATNDSMRWTREILERFRNKLDPYSLSYLTSIPWDFSLLCDFVGIFDLDSLHYNNACWDGAFAEFNDRDTMIALLETARQKKLN